MLDKSTERILKRMDRMGFAGAGEALREIERLREERAEIYAKYQLERGELLTEIERLRGAIRTHKDNVWGVTTIEHEEDKKLYEAIGE